MKLKVPGQTVEPSMDSLPAVNQPQPQDIPSSNPSDQIQLGGQQETPDNNDNPFGDKTFDAGIEADENADPKHYIEQLVGKLAQKLRDYNGNESDKSLNKFVINSLIPAAIPTMDNQDAKDVIDKVRDNIGNGDGDNGSSDIPEIPQNDESPELDNNEEIPQLQQEESTVDNLINEILGSKKLSRNIKNKAPFKTPKFK